MYISSIIFFHLTSKKNLTANLTAPNQEKTLIFIIINFETENHALDK